jgi:uncharacterized membrane protein (TIGR02234 family)
MNASRQAGREYVMALLLGAAGAGLVLLATRQPWAHVVTSAPAPLPSASAAVSGQALVPAAGALALAALAALAAVIATRGTARRMVGVLLVVFGAGMAVAVLARPDAASVLAAAHAAGVPAGASTTGGPGNGAGGLPGAGAPSVTSSARVVLAGAGWRAAAVLGSVAAGAAGVLAAWRGPRWPGLSSRYERPGGAPPAGQPADAAAMWESLTRGVDPTQDPGEAAGPPQARGAAGQGGQEPHSTGDEAESPQ